MKKPRLLKNAFSFFLFLFWLSNLIAGPVVTSEEYAQFLNSNASRDEHHLYEGIGCGLEAGGDLILRYGEPGNYSYEAAIGKENIPMNFVSCLDAARYCNWKVNIASTGDLNGRDTPSILTEYGTYGFDGDQLITILSDAPYFVSMGNRGNKEVPVNLINLACFALTPSFLQYQNAGVDLLLKINQVHFSLLDNQSIQESSGSMAVALGLEEELEDVLVVLALAGGVALGEDNNHEETGSFRANPHLRAPAAPAVEAEKQRIKTELQAMVTRDKDVIYHEQADEQWNESQKARKERTARWDEFQRQEELRVRAQALAIKEEENRTQKNSNGTVLTRIAGALNGAGGAAALSPDPHAQVASPLLQLLAEGIKGINYLLTNREVFWAKTVETVMAEEAAKAQEEHERAQLNAPHIGSKAQMAEDDLRKKVRNDVVEIAKTLKPPTESSQEGAWKEWATRIVAFSKGTLDASWIDKIAQGLANPIWASKSVAVAWIQRMQASKDKKNELTDEMKRLKSISEELKKSSQEATAKQDTVEFVTAKQQEAFDAQAAAEESLAIANREQQQLEADIRARKVTDSKLIADQRRERERAISDAQQVLKECQDNYKTWSETLEKENVTAAIIKGKALEDLECYLDLEEIVQRQSERLENSVQADQEAWVKVFSKEAEQIKNDEKALSKIDSLFKKLRKAEDFLWSLWEKAQVTSPQDAGFLMHWKKAVKGAQSIHSLWNKVEEGLQKNHDAAFLPFKPRWSDYLHSVQEPRNFWIEQLEKAHVEPPLILDEETEGLGMRLLQQARTGEINLIDTEAASTGREGHRTAEPTEVSDTILLPEVTEQDDERLALREELDQLIEESKEGAVNSRTRTSSNASDQQHSSSKDLRIEMKRLQKEWNKLAREADVQRRDSTEKPFLNDKVLLQAWREHDQKAICAKKEHDARLEKKALDQQLAEAFKQDTLRWKARVKLDELILKIKLKETEKDHLDINDPEWTEKDDLLEQEIQPLKKEEKEAEAVWNEMADQHQSIVAVRDQGEEAIEKARRRLAKADDVVLELWKKFQDHLVDGIFDASRIRTTSASTDEIEACKQVLLQEKESALAASLENYPEAIERIALKDAKDNHPGNKEAWEFVAIQAKEEVATLQAVQGETEETRRLDAIAIAGQAAFNAFETEVQRLDDIQKRWIDQAKQQAKADKEKREAAAQQYHQDDHLPWIMLTAQERSDYNKFIKKTNEERLAVFQKKLKDAEAQVEEAKKDLANVNSFFLLSLRSQKKSDATKKLKQAEAELARIKEEEDERQKKLRWPKLTTAQKAEELSREAFKLVESTIEKMKLSTIGKTAYERFSLRKAAICYEQVSRYWLNVIEAIDYQSSEKAKSWTEAAQQACLAAEHRDKAVQAFESHNNEEAKRLNNQASSHEIEANKLAGIIKHPYQIKELIEMFESEKTKLDEIEQAPWYKSFFIKRQIPIVTPILTWVGVETGRYTQSIENMREIFFEIITIANDWLHVPKGSKFNEGEMEDFSITSNYVKEWSNGFTRGILSKVITTADNWLKLHKEGELNATNIEDINKASCEVIDQAQQWNTRFQEWELELRKSDGGRDPDEEGGPFNAPKPENKKREQKNEKAKQEEAEDKKEPASEKQMLENLRKEKEKSRHEKAEKAKTNTKAKKENEENDEKSKEAIAAAKGRYEKAEKELAAHSIITYIPALAWSLTIGETTRDTSENEKNNAKKDEDDAKKKREEFAAERERLGKEENNIRLGILEDTVEELQIKLQIKEVDSK